MAADNPTRHHPDSEVTALRQRINAIDGQILRLLGQRMSAAREIGALKAAAGGQVIDSRREFEVFSQLLAESTGSGLGARETLDIFQRVIDASRRRQQPDGGTFAAPALYAVFGDPIGHSLSPLMHATAFWATGCNGVYVAVQTARGKDVIKGIKAVGIRGASVTIPLKESVVEGLDELDAAAARIGAVNTIVNAEGKLKGCNTDGCGAVAALQARTRLSGKRVAVIGAGGAARAVADGVQAAGAGVIISNRTRLKGEHLAAALGCRFVPPETLREESVEILINATPVGMVPNAGQSPVPAQLLRHGMVVMDIVYNPVDTRLLQEAAAAGCETIDGVEMFVRQGARQFEIWTGLEAPVDIMRLFVRAALGG